MPLGNRKKVIVGMSGGVDSSVSAYVLQQQGFEVEGLFMKNWDEDDGTEYCTALADLEDAQKVADRLGIRLHTASFSAEYWDRVFEHFLAEYAAGRTPNPDILCNKEVKFRAFLDYALTLGADFIATGHYAQTCRVRDNTWLVKGADPAKEQSYFLHAVSGTALNRTLFPIGGLLKREVRQIARHIGLVTHDKKDSTGICFIGERKFKDFLKTYLPAKPGPIVSTDGRHLGEHQGLMYHTLGQRQGLGIGGVRGGDEAPWYVVEKCLEDNVLRVAQGSQHPLLFSTGLLASQLHWILDTPPSQEFLCRAKTRYRQPDQPCRVEIQVDEHGRPQARVTFAHPQRAVTPGQSVVFYQGAICLGGGIIEAVTGIGHYHQEPA